MKIYIIILIVLLDASCTMAQTNMLFNKTFTNDTINILAQVVRPISDGYLVWGGYSSTNASNVRYLMKFDELGNFVWSRDLLVGQQWNVIEDGKFLTETNDHHFVLAIGGIVNINDAKEIHLIKMDQEGNEVWHRDYSGDSTKVIQHIIQTSDDGFALAGFRYYEGGTSDTARCLLIKTDTSGYIQWQRTYSMGNDARAFSVQQTPWDGGYILGCWGYSPTMGYDMLVVKTNSVGDSLWARRYGGVHWDWGAQVVPLTSMQEFQMGQPIRYSVTGGWRDTNNDWESKLYIAQLDAIGTVVGQAKKHDNYSFFSSLQPFPIVRPGRRLIGVAGFSNEHGVQNPVIVSFEADGDIEWLKPISPNPLKDCYVKDMRPTADGGYVLAGYQYTVPQTAWVMKIDSLGNTCSFVGCDSTVYVGVGETPVLQGQGGVFKIYPNPARDYLVVENNSQEKNATFVLYDVVGRVVLQQSVSTQNTISTQHLPSGMYLYQFLNPQKQILAYGKISVLR